MILAPHTDDAELGCGGTIARMLKDGVDISVAAFSTAEDSLPPGAVPTQLRDEFLSAMQTLGVPQDKTFVFGYPVRRLSYHRQELLEELVKLRHQIMPHMVFLPSASDLHQDHQVLNAEGLRCFKDMTIWGYELPWNTIRFSAQAFVTLEPCELQAKWKALQAYKSQFDLSRPYFSWEFIEGLARVRGVQVKAPYAEAFEVMRIKW
ncbi:PIG-L deacetylase family protein [Edaphobacter bradus]|uniref:PIG-L deacetylase family protein n=1 Tax=Edaphobacter bradus TaxID=2259016 RepID=UPI0021DFC1FB|nr:PIG-L deacetylase family protein [Edaphobacter bradus]